MLHLPRWIQRIESSSNRRSHVAVPVGGGSQCKQRRWILSSDIEGTNGVIHVIDTVLVPA